MPTPILATKLYIPPPRSKIVLRPRLIERLNEGLSSGRKLTLISASAGFGKTTLVSEWVAGCDQKVAWLSLDEGDNDPARFLTYLIAALQMIDANFGTGVLGVLQNSQPPPIESILTVLVNEITTLPNNIIFVLDDYHIIDSKSVDNALTFLIEHLPPQMHLVIITREDPSLPLPRYRAKNQLTELRAADLRFTSEEADVFLNQMMNLNLSEENIAALEARTEGWIAGLQLAALSMQSREDINGFIQAFTGSHRFVLDYLAGEVLERQPERVRNFLLQTAFLERLCASLCNAVTGREDGKEILDILERNNLFLIPLDDERQWYRYHHLFAEVLQAHLMEALPDQAAALHQRASTWYEHNGFLPDAIHHALAANDFERAAGLIELAWPAAEAGIIQQVIWLGWVNALPDEIFHVRPVLNVDYAFALLGIGKIDAAETRLKDAEGWLKPATGSPGMVIVDKEQFNSLPETIAIGRAYIAQAFGNIQETIKFTRQVLELVPEGDAYRREQASMMLGMTCWASGDLEAANHVFTEYTIKLRTAGNIPDAISTTIVVADIRSALGRLHEAVSAVEQLLKFVMAEGEPIPLDTADLYRGLSELYLELGDLESAAQNLERSRELGGKAEMPVWRYRWLIAYARLNETQHDLDGTLALLDEAERLYVRTPLPNMYSISTMRARIWVAQGRLTEALGWVNRQGLSADDDLSYLRENEHITLARILIAQYQNDPMDGLMHTILQFLDRLLQAAQEGSRMGSVIRILVVQALAHQAQGNLMLALASIERALTLAEPEGYVRIFLDEGNPVAELLAKIESEDATRRLKEYVLKLLSAFEMLKALPPVEGTPVEINKLSDRSQPLIEPLSERELEVLRLLRSELSGPQIARDRTVSLSTIRTHIQHIYAKLGVNNRRAAVRRAEKLDLI